MTRALITIAGQEDRTRAKRWVDAAPIGCRIEFKAAARSIDQNSALWAMLSEVSHAVIWHGRRLAPADWKDVFTASLKRAQIVPNIDGDGFVQIGLHTSDLTKDEMSNLLDLIDAFGAQHGVVFRNPPPTSTADAPAVDRHPPPCSGDTAGAPDHSSTGGAGPTPGDSGGAGPAMEPTVEHGNDQPLPRAAIGLPLGWDILYAAALRRAKTVADLGAVASRFWRQEQFAKFGGWKAIKEASEGERAIMIYDAFHSHFDNDEAREDILREIVG